MKFLGAMCFFYVKKSPRPNKFLQRRLFTLKRLETGVSRRFNVKKTLSERRDSNSRPPLWESGTLPTELLSLFEFYVDKQNRV